MKVLSLAPVLHPVVMLGGYQNLPTEARRVFTRAAATG
jgi:hypothetical protein